MPPAAAETSRTTYAWSDRRPQRTISDCRKFRRRQVPAPRLCILSTLEEERHFSGDTDDDQTGKKDRSGCRGGGDVRRAVAAAREHGRSRRAGRRRSTAGARPCCDLGSEPGRQDGSGHGRRSRDAQAGLVSLLRHSAVHDGEGAPRLRPPGRCEGRAGAAAAQGPRLEAPHRQPVRQSGRTRRVGDRVRLLLRRHPVEEGPRPVRHRRDGPPRSRVQRQRHLPDAEDPGRRTAGLRRGVPPRSEAGEGVDRLRPGRGQGVQQERPGDVDVDR